MESFWTSPDVCSLKAKLYYWRRQLRLGREEIATEKILYYSGILEAAKAVAKEAAAAAAAKKVGEIRSIDFIVSFS